jgi:hypothetical protein
MLYFGAVALADFAGRTHLKFFVYHPIAGKSHLGMC